MFFINKIIILQNCIIIQNTALFFIAPLLKCAICSLIEVRCHNRILLLQFFHPALITGLFKSCSIHQQTTQIIGTDRIDFFFLDVVIRPHDKRHFVAGFQFVRCIVSRGCVFS